jgi:hypothetical protein
MTTLTNVLRNAKVVAATGAMNGGRLKLLTSADAVVADIALPTPAFLPPSAGQAFTFGTLTDPFTGAGTIAKYRIENASGALLVSGAVTGIGGGGDIELADLDFNSGDRLEISSLGYAQPAT